MEEGYIKFKALWEKAPALPATDLQEIVLWRNEMHRLKLIGVYNNGIGYGNISVRHGTDNGFIITGSATGHLPSLSSAHFTKVEGFDIEKNEVRCAGPVVASSESMSHAVIYQQCPEVNGVIHVHHAEMWERLVDKAPTTWEDAAYGTPEMARSIVALLKGTGLPEQKIFVMKGHPEGIFSFGKNLKEAAQVLKKYLSG